MRERLDIEEDSKNGNIPYEKLILEVLLDIRELNNIIVKREGIHCPLGTGGCQLNANF